MKNETAIVTAANSRIMNAIEKTKLFAAASDNEPVINFNGEERVMFNNTSSGKKTFLRKRIKQK